MQCAYCFEDPRSSSHHWEYITYALALAGFLRPVSFFRIRLMIDNNSFGQWFSGLTLCVHTALKIPGPVPTTHHSPPHTPDPDRAFLSRNPLKGLSLGPDWIGQVPQPTRGTLLSLGSLATSNLLGNPS